MKNQTHVHFVVTVLVCLLSVGCGQMKEAGKTLGALAEVRGEIIKKFGENEVNVNLRTFGSSSSVNIAFINSALNQKDGEERQKRAQETAVIVKNHYSDIKNISQIAVTFMKVETRFLVVTTTFPVDYYTFDNLANLTSGGGEGSTESSGDEPPFPSYSEASNETTISARFQLDGVPGKGLTMIATMRATGDTSKVTPKAPNTVSFDFASFSKEAKFSADTPVKFKGDDRVIFEANGEFSKGPGTEGMINQFAYLTIPFTKFRELSGSHKASLSIGEHNFDFSEKQIDSMRKMVQYVK